jgi:pro-sigmaK processing inhibitor BofA
MDMRTVLLVGVLLLLLRLARLRLRLGCKLLLNALCGLGCLLVLNLLSPITGMLFELNILTTTVAGALGLPGVALLLVAHVVLN